MQPPCDRRRVPALACWRNTPHFSRLHRRCWPLEDGSLASYYFRMARPVHRAAACPGLRRPSQTRGRCRPPRTGCCAPLALRHRSARRRLARRGRRSSHQCVQVPASPMEPAQASGRTGQGVRPFGGVHTQSKSRAADAAAPIALRLGVARNPGALREAASPRTILSHTSKLPMRAARRSAVEQSLLSAAVMVPGITARRYDLRGSHLPACAHAAACRRPGPPP